MSLIHRFSQIILRGNSYEDMNYPKIRFAANFVIHAMFLLGRMNESRIITFLSPKSSINRAFQKNSFRNQTIPLFLSFPLPIQLKAIYIWLVGVVHRYNVLRMNYDQQMKLILFHFVLFAADRMARRTTSQQSFGNCAGDAPNTRKYLIRLSFSSFRRLFGFFAVVDATQCRVKQFIQTIVK